MNYILCVGNVFIVSIFLYVFLLLAKTLFLTCADLNGTAEMPHPDRFVVVGPPFIVFVFLSVLQQCDNGN